MTLPSTITSSTNRAAMRSAILHHHRRRAAFGSVPRPVHTFAVRHVQPPDKTTSIGLEITKVFTINIATLDNEVLHGELLDAEGAVMWSGLGDDRAAGLLEMITHLDNVGARRHEVEIVPARPENRTSLGFTVIETYTITVGNVDGDVLHWELCEASGEVMLSGLGDDRADALIAMLCRLVDNKDSPSADA